MEPSPKPPPFKAGTRLRYLGTRDASYEVGGKMVPVVRPGLEVLVVKVHPGWRGTGRTMFTSSGEPFKDETEDGYSIYEAPGGTKACIDGKDKGEWEVLGPALMGERGSE